MAKKHFNLEKFATAARLEGWNAEPNAPAAVVTLAGDDVVLDFDLNP